VKERRDRGERQRVELEGRDIETDGETKRRDKGERQRGETGGETEEKIQKRETEDQKYRWERELERKIVEKP
jgi:hypothetical protein